MIVEFNPLTLESVMELYEIEVSTLNFHLKKYNRPYGYTESTKDGINVYSSKGDFMFEIPTENTNSGHNLLVNLVDRAKSMLYSKK